MRSLKAGPYSSVTALLLSKVRNILIPIHRRHMDMTDMLTLERGLGRNQLQQCFYLRPSASRTTRE